MSDVEFWQACPLRVSLEALQRDRDSLIRRGIIEAKFTAEGWRYRVVKALEPSIDVSRKARL